MKIPKLSPLGCIRGKYAKKEDISGVFLYHIIETINALKTTDMKTLATTLAAVLMISMVLTSSAQIPKRVKICKSEVVVQLNASVTGSGHGALSSASLGYRFCHNMLSIGSIMQNDYHRATGISANYQYEIKGFRKVDLFFNVNSNYFYKAHLSKELNHSLHNSDFLKDTENGRKEFEKFNTMEVYAGFGLVVNLTQNFALTAGIAGGGYLSNIVNTDYRRPYSISRLDRAAGLQMNIGIAFNTDLKMGF